MILALLVGVVAPIIFYYNQNAVDNNLQVTGDDAGAFGYYKDMGHLEAIWISGLGPWGAIFLLALALLVIALMVILALKQRS